MRTRTRSSARRAALTLGGVCATLATVLAAPATAQAATPTGSWVSIAPTVPEGGPAEYTWSDEPGPGMSIWQRDGESNVECTASWAVLDPDTGEAGLLTAGHCDQLSSPTYRKVPPFSSWKSMPPLTDQTMGTDGDGFTVDAALLPLPGLRKGDFRIDPYFDVDLAGVLTVEQIRAMPTGTPLCMHGSRAGLTCGPLLSADTDEIDWGGGAYHGDSGAPVFAVDSAGKAWAVGMLRAGPTDTFNQVTYLAPLLHNTGLKVLLDN